MSDKNPHLPLSILLFVMLSATPAVAQDAPSLQWELVNPFRFIRDQAAIDELRDVYLHLPLDQKTAYALERELQDRSENQVRARRAAAASQINCDNPKLNNAGRKRCFEPFLGWFSDLSRNNYLKTCWNSETHKFRTDEDGCKDYIFPKSHNVRIWIENAPPGASAPTWFLDGQQLTAPKTCAPKYQKNICIEIPIAYDVKQPKTVNISATLSDGTVIEPKPVTVVDNLIVGLGDSYAAGEGNPDRPAQFTENNSEKDRLPFLLDGHPFKAIKGEKHPQKDNGKEVQVNWLDERCHRSMYSYQFKTSLQLALANPQEAITFVSYSCSGATTDHILSDDKKPIEGHGKVDPQLKSLKTVLSNGNNETREIDYLLLSTGGNDIGFATFVAYCLLSKGALTIFEHNPKGVNEKKIIEGDQEKSFEASLLGNKGSYIRLNEWLRGQKPESNHPAANAIKIKDCLPGGPCKRVLLTPYPNILNREDGKLCEANRMEFDKTFGTADRSKRIDTLNSHVFEQIKNVQADVRITDVLGWTVIEKNVDAYATNGFCAQTSDRPLPPAETFELPKWENERWITFDPSLYNPYASRLRWVRLPIDAKLTTDQMHTFWGKINIDILLEDDRSIIMHPTAQGLAKTADANVEAIQLIRMPH
jgi:hypothetical protein